MNSSTPICTSKIIGNTRYFPQALGTCASQLWEMGDLTPCFPNPVGTGKIWRSAFADPSFATAALVTEKVALAKLPGAGKAFLKALRSMSGLGGFKPEAIHDTHEKIRRVKVPTLVISGRQDKFLPISHLATFMKLIPGAQAAVIDNCGHAPMIEHVAEFNRLALGFLA